MSICIWPHHLLLLGLSNRLPPSSASILAVWHVPMLLVLREMKKNRLKKCALVRNWREKLRKEEKRGEGKGKVDDCWSREGGRGGQKKTTDDKRVAKRKCLRRHRVDHQSCVTSRQAVALTSRYCTLNWKTWGRRKEKKSERSGHGQGKARAKGRRGA